MKTILAPTDFSKGAQHAVDYAAEIAKLSHAKLILFHVFSIPIITAEMPLVAPWDNIESDSILSLEKIKKELQAKHGNALHIECICRMGYAADEIIREFTKEHKIDLVVMGMRGTGYMNEHLIGSNTTALIKHALCPVLIINEQITFRQLKEIVLAYDYGNLPAQPVFQTLKDFVALFHGHISILNVVNDYETHVRASHAQAEMSIEKQLEGIPHSYHALENKDTIAGIQEFTQRKSADLIVFIPQQHRFPENIFHRSNTKRMAFNTSLPLLALHA